MATMRDIAEAAITFVGAKFEHQGRLPDRHDCLGHLALTMKAVGLEVKHHTEAYNRIPNEARLLEEIMQQADPCDEQVGCILHIQVGKKRKLKIHLGIRTEHGIVDSTWRMGTTHRRITDEMRSDIVGCYRLKGVE